MTNYWMSHAFCENKADRTVLNSIKKGGDVFCVSTETASKLRSSITPSAFSFASMNTFNQLDAMVVNILQITGLR